MSVALCVGTGRCGTTFLTALAAEEPLVAASHERLRLAATFHLYCAWNGIPVDPEGFLVDREGVVGDDLARRPHSFEASALLSHSLRELHGRLRPKIVWLVRRPDHTVASFAARGWYREPPPRSRPDLPPTYREGEEPRHFFGRMVPRGEAAFARWAGSTALGRIAWFWAARNTAIQAQLADLPPEDVRLQRLEDLDHAAWVELAAFLGWRATVDRARFDALAASRLNAGPNPPRGPAGWSPQERAEFEREVGPLAAALGYEASLDALAAGQPALRGPAPTLAALFGSGG